MKKYYLGIVFAIAVIILILITMKETSTMKFVDPNFESYIINAIKNKRIEEDLSAVSYLAFSDDDEINNFEDLKKFYALEQLELSGFSQKEINNILDNCLATLLYLHIYGGVDYSLGSRILSASKEVVISNDEQISVYPIADSEVACKRLHVHTNKIKGTEYIGALKDMEIIELNSAEKSDTEIDASLIAENSPTISEFITEGVAILNYEAIATMNNLEALILKDTDVEKGKWLEGLDDKIDYMIIEENDGIFSENIFED